jgi:phosphatidate cytidylyltransferase
MLIWVWGGGVAGAVLLAMTQKMPAFVAWGILYTGVPIASLIVLRNDPAYGLAAIGWLFAVVWSTDSAAYFSGKAIGGPKLSPRWSPNKTWAGLGGGVVAAALTGLVTALLIGHTSVPVLMLFSGLLAIIAQIGDIFESALKRRAGIKDSSHIIPGHGGVMDRLDGMVSAAAVAIIVAATRGGEGFAAGVLLW